MIQTEFVLYFSFNNPFIFVTNSSSFDKLIQIPIQYYKIDIYSKSLIIKVNKSLQFYCSRNIIVDLLPLKMKNVDKLRMIGSKLLIPLKKNISSKCIIFPETLNSFFKGITVIKYFLKVLF